MGQSNESETSNFNMMEYLARRPELHEREVVEIKNMFDSMVPINGLIDVDDIENYYSNAAELKTIRGKFGEKKQANFDEFFDVISVVLLERRNKYKNIDFESNSRNVSCFYCPYPSEKMKVGATN